MVSDRSTDVNSTIDRIFRERLEQYGVPLEVRTELRKEILAYIQRPEKKPFGACTMTIEASMAADQAKKEHKTQEGGAVPKIV